MKFFLILILLSSVRPCLLAQTLTTPESQPIHQASLEQLLAKPQQYDGQLVQLKGYLHLAYEAHAIYSQQDDVAKHRSKNGLWVRFSVTTTKQQLADCNRTYVIMAGTFDAQSKGHLGLFGGTLTNITSLTKQLPIK